MTLFNQLLCCLRKRSKKDTEEGYDETDPLLQPRHTNGHGHLDIPVEVDTPPQVDGDAIRERLGMTVDISVSKMIDVRALRPFNPSSPDVSVSRSAQPRSRQPSPTPYMQAARSSTTPHANQGVEHLSLPDRVSDPSFQVLAQAETHRGRSRSRQRLGRFGDSSSEYGKNSGHSAESKDDGLSTGLTENAPTERSSAQNPTVSSDLPAATTNAYHVVRSRPTFVIHNTAQVARSWGD